VVSVNARHNAKYVEIEGKALHLGNGVTVRAGRQGQLQVGGVNAREVERAGRLVLLGLQGERVNVDALVRGDLLVVLVRLHQVEVRPRALGKPVVAVQLQQRLSDVVDVAGQVGQQSRRVDVAGGVVVPLVGGRALDRPHQLLDGVVEVQLDGVGARGDGLLAGVLQLLNQVLVRELGEAAALIGVQEDVVNPQRRVGHVSGQHGAGAGHSQGGLELDVDLHLVVLQGNQGQGQADVAAEPELQGHVDGGGDGLNRVEANHLLVALNLAGGQGQLIPDVHPVRVVLVHALATDLHLGGLQQTQTGPVDVSLGGLDRQNRLQVDAVDQITVAGDLASDAAAEADGAIDVCAQPFGLFTGALSTPRDETIS